MPSAWSNWKYKKGINVDFRCKSLQPQPEDSFPRKTPTAFVPADLTTLHCFICKLQALKTPSNRCFMRRPSKTAFPTKKQSLLLDNNENRNSSLGNIILKSDFPTNHTQLVSNAMFLSDYGIPADFLPVSILWVSVLPQQQQKKGNKTPSWSYIGGR